MKRYIKVNASKQKQHSGKVYAWVEPEDAECGYSVAMYGDWEAYNWEDDAWGKLVSYDKATKLYTVQWSDGHTSQHRDTDLMTIEQANEANRRYWEGRE